MPPKRNVKPTLPSLHSKTADLVLGMLTANPEFLGVGSDLVRAVFECIKDVILHEKHKNKKPAKVLSTAEKISKFQSWLERNGINMREIPVTISEFEEFGLGLKATKPIAMEDIVLKIPSNLILKSSEAKQELIRMGFETGAIDIPDVALSLFVALESTKPDSHWKPYFDLLPETLSVPWMWSFDEIQQVPDRTIALRSIVAMARVALEYCRFYKFMSSNDKLRKSTETFTMERYRWARAIVETRRNVIPDLSDPSQQPDSSSSSSSSSSFMSEAAPGALVTLVPFWDLINHSSKATKITSFFEPEINSLVFKAPFAFETGEQVFMFYGERANDDLLEHSGFVLNDNPFDVHQFSLRISKNDPFLDRKNALLEANNVPLNSQVTLRKDKIEFDLPFLRLILCDEELLNTLDMKMPIEEISIHNEVFSYELLLNTLRSLVQETQVSPCDPIRCRENVLKIVRQYKMAKGRLIESAIEDLCIKFKVVLDRAEGYQDDEKQREAELAMMQDTSQLALSDPDIPI